MQLRFEGNQETKSKYWEQRYSYKRTPRTIGIGSYPEVSLADARAIAVEKLRLVRAGKDPIVEKRREPVPTFSQASAEVHALHRSSWSSTRGAQDWLRLLEINVFLITTQAKRNLSSRSGIGGVRSAT